MSMPGANRPTAVAPATAPIRRLACASTLLAAWIAMGAAHAQPPASAPASAPAPTPAASTGDAWVDATLPDIGRYAARYPDAFVDELDRYQAAPRDLVARAIGAGHWPPGDVYFACAMAHAAAQPCRAVVAMRAQDPSHDWAALEQRLGVAPGSVGFQRIKRGIVASYARWARPLQVDASLHADQFTEADVDAIFTIARRAIQAVDDPLIMNTGRAIYET